MTKQEKYNAVTTAYTTKQVADSREIISIIKDTTPIEVIAKLLDIQQSLNTTHELSYSIFHDASNCVSDIPLNKLESTDWNEVEPASVYTSTRLAYLNNLNQMHISVIATQYACYIADACAIWYNQKVAEACQALVAYILE